MDPRELTDAQPAPRYRPGAPSMHDVAAVLHRIRRDHGWEKYGSLLQTGNGRFAAVDGLQESLDRLVYDVQQALEQRAFADALEQFGVNLREVAARQDPRAAGARWALELFVELCRPSAVTAAADDLAKIILHTPEEDPT